ncbi:MAG TPA: DUF4331 family protein [Thermoanaerobaculia bacterium]|nr:DUF4331 family protein [Thermoanaerobaculia bacterium]
MRKNAFGAILLALTILCALAGPAAASSHREAPAITETPKVDGTDFYMFNSYEAGREGYVTLIANYLPLQDAYGGPNYFALDPDARYRIHIDNTGDGVEDITFQFRVTEALRDLQVPAGGQNVSVPLINIGQVSGGPGAESGTLNRLESFTLAVIRGRVNAPPGSSGRSTAFVHNANGGGTRFGKPVDNIGRKSIPNYAAYASQYIQEFIVPGCGTSTGRVFVGQRDEPFAVNLGEVFDLVNIDNPLGPRDAEPDSLRYKNVTTFAIEVPAECLTAGGPTIGGWTTAALPRVRTLVETPTFEDPSSETGDFVQVSRLGMPLVNEVVIGLKDKNLFNASAPDHDGQFLLYVTNPTLPELLGILFGAAGVQAPNNFPRNDLVAAFLTGVAGLNQFGSPAEMVRLNTSISAVAAASQNNLGVLGGDNAGFPNGRRPGDDVVDIELRVAMGVLCHAFPGVFCTPADAPSGNLPFTDGTLQDASQFDSTFPYLRTPFPGSPNNGQTFAIGLSGSQEVPPRSTTATGSCVGVLNQARTELSVACVHDVAGVVGAHIHRGAPGVNGPIICDFGAAISPIEATCALTPDLVEDLATGNLYINVHSGTFPGGEIRGQIQ